MTFVDTRKASDAMRSLDEAVPMPPQPSLHLVPSAARPRPESRANGAFSVESRSNGAVDPYPDPFSQPQEKCGRCGVHIGWSRLVSHWRLYHGDE